MIISIGLIMMGSYMAGVAGEIIVEKYVLKGRGRAPWWVFAGIGAVLAITGLDRLIAEGLFP